MTLGYLFFYPSISTHRVNMVGGRFAWKIWLERFCCLGSSAFSYYLSHTHIYTHTLFSPTLDKSVSDPLILGYHYWITPVLHHNSQRFT